MQASITASSKAAQYLLLQVWIRRR